MAPITATMPCWAVMRVRHADQIERQLQPPRPGAGIHAANAERMFLTTLDLTLNRRAGHARIP